MVSSSTICVIVDSVHKIVIFMILFNEVVSEQKDKKRMSKWIRQIFLNSRGVYK
jgi:hypothetical protein